MTVLGTTSCDVMIVHASNVEIRGDQSRTLRVGRKMSAGDKLGRKSNARGKKEQEAKNKEAASGARPKSTGRRSTVDAGTFEIPVWVGGLQKWVTGVTRRTTCDDVVRALLVASGKAPSTGEDRRSHYGLVERWRKMERTLEGRSRVLRVWRAWGDEAPDVKLTLRKLAPTTPRSVKTVQHQRPPPWRPRDKTRTLHPRRLLRDNPGDEDDLDGRITDTMDRLMQVIVVQGETIQAQLRRLREQEHQIERFEHHRHRQRVQQMGANYLLDSYLQAPDASTTQPGDDLDVKTAAPPLTTTVSATAGNETVPQPALLDPETTAACARLYEALLEICTKLEREEEKLVSLSRLLALEQTRELIGEGEGGVEETRSTKDEVDRLAVLNSNLALEIAQNERRLQDAHSLLVEKKEEASRLVEEEGRVDAQTHRLRARLHGLNQQQEEKVVEEPGVSGGVDKGDNQDTDSNSDTGLSSLHSSEDGGYGLNTLV